MARDVLHAAVHHRGSRVMTRPIVPISRHRGAARAAAPPLPAIDARACTIYPTRGRKLIAMLALALVVVAPVAIAVALAFLPWRRRHD